MKNKTKLLSAIGSVFLLTTQNRAYAAGIESGQTIVFDSLDKLLRSIILSVQYYTLPIMAIALILLGIKLLTSIYNKRTVVLIKSWLIKIFIIGVIIFSTSTIVTLIYNIY